MRLLIIFILSPFFLFSQTQIGNDIDGMVAGDNAGYAVSISANGSIVAVGSPGNNGYVRVFENTSGEWEQLGNTIFGETAGDSFGSSVSLSSDGTIVAIGSPDAEVAGYVRVYENIGGVWTQIGDDLIGEIDALSNFSFGRDVSVSDDGTILAIAEDRGGDNFEPQYGHPGFIHMFENVLGTWTPIGDYIDTEVHYLEDISISADESTIACFGRGDNPSLSGFDGQVNVFKNISGVWTQLGDTFVGNLFSKIKGVSLSDNGSKLAISGYDINGSDIKVYENIDGDWVQLGYDIETEYNFYGNKTSLSEDGTKLVVGGSITRIYENSSGNWTQLGIDINEEAPGDDFGSSLELSTDGTTLIVGAPQNDGNGTNAGYARVFDLSALLSSDDFTLSQFSLFPNPAKDQFTISLYKSLELDHINIYNHLAQLMCSTQKITVNTSHLSSGMYFVEVVTDKGKATKKLILH